jgi:mRNA interferase MazF
MNRGEIWLVALPLASGREQGGQRPAVVLQDSTYGQGSPLVMVALLTSQLAALRFPAALRIDPTTSNGLTVPSVAMVFQTRALDRSRFLKKLGEVSPEQLQQLVSELRKLIGEKPTDDE